ncbi:MAG: MMPL family transporter, partial [Bacteroidota bacterium]|nr:MMPL family transporter [Bacteroidota bacterium]MDX5429977.1 MMPL family transporter [Bacteroidota bacterium]MDX5468750.1 MMPL family transporter [Bacteroidota bacterium]
MWVKISSFILRYRVAVGIVLALITGLMGFLATKTEMAYELTKVIPDDDPANIVYERFKETFGEDGSVMVVGVETDRLFELEFFRDWYLFTEKIDSLENVEKLISITKLYDLQKNDSLYKFQVIPLVTKVPESQAEVDSIRQKIDLLPFYSNYLYNPETNATFLAVTMDDYGVNSHRRVEIVEAIEKFGSELSEKYGIELHYSGVPYIRTVNTRKISKELALFTFLSVVITGLFLLIFFRSLQIVVTSLILVIVSLIYTIGSMYLLGFKIGILTALIPPLIVVIAIQNCIYLLNVY